MCIGCGAPEEVVKETMEAVQKEYTHNGSPAGTIPESLLADAPVFIEEDGQVRASPFHEPWVEGPTDSGRSIAELVAKHKEIRDG